MTWWMKLLLIGALVASIAGGAAAIRSHYVNQGDAQGAARVQAAWDKQKLVDDAAALVRLQQANADQLTKFRNAERITDEQTNRAQIRARRTAALGNAVDGLLHTIDTLNGRSLPAAASNAATAGLAQDATTARELLGSCAAAHRDLAKEADGLRDQVMGLQDYALHVCPGIKASDAR